MDALSCGQPSCVFQQPQITYPDSKPVIPRYDLSRVIIGDYQQSEIPYLPPKKGQSPSCSTKQQLDREVLLEQYRKQKRRLTRLIMASSNSESTETSEES